MLRQLSVINKFEVIEPSFIEAIFNSINDPISVIDVKNFELINVNRKFLELYGFRTEEEVLGGTCYEVTHNRQSPCKKPDNTCPLIETLKTGNPSVFEHIHYDRGGSEIFVETSASPIRNHLGEITHVVHIVRDVTQKKLVEKQIEQAKKEWERTFDAINIPITIHDMNFNIIRANQAASEYLQMPFKEIMGQKCHKLFNHADMPAAGCPAVRVAETLQPENLTVINSGNKKTLLVSALPLLEDGNLTGIIHIIRDVTLQAATRKKLSEAMEQERKIISGEIHDGILQTLYGASIYCKKAKSRQDVDSEYLNKAVALLDETMKTARKLLIGIRSPIIENLGLKRALKDLINVLFKNSGIRIRAEIADTQKSEIDIVIYRVTQEMLLNTLKHSRAKNVTVKLEQLENEYKLSISDDGVGFKPDEEFFQNKTLKGHIGLQAAFEKIEMFGGRYTLKSDVEKGTEIQMFVPVPILKEQYGEDIVG